MHFEYDPESGTIYDVSVLKVRRAITVRLKRGYPLIYCNNQRYLAHRLAWELMMGEPPTGRQVRFNDGNPLNLKWENICG